MSKKRLKNKFLNKNDSFISNASIKILLSYHKQDKILRDDILTPIHAGRTLAITNNKPDLAWLLENTIGDNEGENISYKNASYNELTSVYWAWKNFANLGNPNYIGFMHYRRHLMFKGGDKAVYEFGDINEDYLADKLGYSHEKLLELAESYDMIVPRAQWRVSMREHFNRNHDTSDLDTAISILKEKYPELSTDADEYLNGDKAYFCNMFIMPRELFFKYASYLFDILFEFEKRVDISKKRLFISEWLTGIFIQHQINSGRNICFLPTAVAESSHDIPVLFATDNGYALYLGVALTSLLKNAKPETRYIIRVLISEDFTEENKNKILLLLEKYPNHSIDFHTVNERMFDNVSIKTKHLSKVTFYRLLAADIFQDWDKCIYLDIDIIVLQDLTIFFRYALDDNLVAGIKAPGYMYPEKWKQEKLNELKIPSMDQYINAGVIILDFKKIRDEKLTERFIELSLNNYSSEDQDVLNIICYGRIKHLPYKYNAMTKYTDPKSAEHYKAINVFPKDWIDEAEKNPVIIHYANAIKPWQDLNLHKAHIWLEYAHISTFCNELNVRAEKQYKAQIVKSRLEYLKRGMRFGEDIVRSIPDNAKKTKGVKYKISIIMPVYNAAGTVSESLDSAIIQTGAMGNTIEIICVDDGSTDNSLNILCAYADHFDFIKIYTQPNTGSGAARNKALAVAQGEFVVFLDSDDWYPSETTLENLYGSVTKNGALICGGSYCSSPSATGRVFNDYKFPLDGYVFKERRFINYFDYQYDFGYQRFIYKTKFIHDNKITFPDYLRYQDPPFFAKVMAAAGSFYAVPEMTYRYRVNHKAIDWNIRRTTDLISALTEMFLFSKHKKYAKLHGYTYLRFKNHEDPISLHLRNNDFTVYSLVAEMFNTIDIDLLKQSRMPIEQKELGAAVKMLSDLCSKAAPPHIKGYEQRIEVIELRLKLSDEREKAKEEQRRLIAEIEKRNESTQAKINEERMEILDLRLALSEERERAREEHNILTNEIAKRNEAIMIMEASWTWRIGRFFVWLPGKVKKLFIRKEEEI